MVIAMIALAVAMSGTAVAAVLIGSKDIAKNAVLSKHIKNGQVKTADLAKNVRSQLKKTGKAGPTGAAGAPGPAGLAGAAGAKGDTGEPGPSKVYYAKSASIDVPAAMAPIATLTIPEAGSYLLNAKMLIDADGVGSSVVSCTLTAGSETDQLWASLGASGSDDEYEMGTLTLAQTFAAGGAAVLSCEAGAGDVDAYNVKMTATKVGSITGATL